MVVINSFLATESTGTMMYQCHRMPAYTHVPYTTRKPINTRKPAAYSLTTANEDDILSYGNRDDADPLPGALTLMTLIDPKDDNSKSKLPWMVKIGELLDLG